MRWAIALPPILIFVLVGNQAIWALAINGKQTRGWEDIPQTGVNLQVREGPLIPRGTQILEFRKPTLTGITYPHLFNVTSLPFRNQVPTTFFTADPMPTQISADIFHDPNIYETVKELHELISRLYLPKLGARKFEDTERRYNAKKSILFAQISSLLGLAPIPAKSEDVIKAANELAILYFAKYLWRFTTSHRYFPVSYVVWVLTMLVTAAPFIYNSLAECEKSPWLIIGTVAAIVCDVLEVLAISITMMATAGRTRSVLLKIILPTMLVVKLAGKIAKVAGQRFNIGVLGEFSGEGMLMFCRFLVVIKSRAKWKISSVRPITGNEDGNWLTKEEELLVMGLVLDHKV